MPSEKTPVIEYLFLKHWDEKKKRLTRTLMTFDDVLLAIRHCNEKFGSTLSEKNPANFLKDIVRGQGASAIWPEKLKELRYTAAQRPGDGNVFEFIPYPTGTDEPFPDIHKPSKSTPRFKIESLSLSLDAKQLGRADEPWLVQTAVNLRVVETHFAVSSRIKVVQISHLQMSVKLRQTEIDALFLAICESETGERFRTLITCEAKQHRERVLEDQIINQVKAAFEITDVDLVVPVGLRAVKGVGFYLVEFQPVSRALANQLDKLELASAAVYELLPPVPGV